MTKPKWFFYVAVVAALLAIGGGMAWGFETDTRMPTQAEVWGWIKTEGFGPSIMGHAWNSYTTIEEVELSDDGRFLYVVYRTPSMAMYMTYPPTQAPDSVWRDVYGVKDGRIVMLGQQGARVTPEKVEPESYRFEPWE